MHLFREKVKQSLTQHPAQPFQCSYDLQVPALLHNLNCTIVLSTFQAGKLVLFSANDENQLGQLPRSFKKPMGIAYDPATEKLALACEDEIIVFKNAPGLAAHYPRAPRTYDALFMPRVTYHTGALDIHDLGFGAQGELIGVNTLFSSIDRIDDNYNFTPIWKPPFIDKLVSEDRCHLNGMAIVYGKPKYATAFGKGNSAQSWRENLMHSGLLIDIETDEIVVEGLPMPHSPRFYSGEIYVLLSATGQLVRVNAQKGNYEIIIDLGGFARGMSIYMDYAFIGLSKLRSSSVSFSKIDPQGLKNEAGVVILHLPTGKIVGKISYSSSVEEIYEVQIIPNYIRPNILNTLTPDFKDGLSTPEATFWVRKNSN